MFTLTELACAVEEGLPVVILLWHNQGYEEIRRYMDGADVPRLGVDIQAPDFQMLAAGFGCMARRVRDPQGLASVLRQRPASGPILVEIDAAAWQASVAPGAGTSSRNDQESYPCKK